MKNRTFHLLQKADILTCYQQREFTGHRPFAAADELFPSACLTMQKHGTEHPMRLTATNRLPETVPEKFPPRSVSETPLAALGERSLLRNRGIPLQLDWLDRVRVNTSAVERRAQTHTVRRTVKKEWQAAWLLRAITCMDLTTLSGDDTDERVRRLCAKARQPIQHDLMEKLGIEDLEIKVAAVCVYHRFV